MEYEPLSCFFDYLDMTDLSVTETGDAYLKAHL